MTPPLLDWKDTRNSTRRVCDTGWELKKNGCFYHFYFPLLFQRQPAVFPPLWEIAREPPRAPESAAPCQPNWHLLPQDSPLYLRCCTCPLPAPQYPTYLSHSTLALTGLEPHVFATDDIISCKSVSEKSILGLACTWLQSFAVIKGNFCCAKFMFRGLEAIRVQFKCKPNIMLKK